MDLSINALTGAASGTLTLTGVDATEATINLAFAGATGTVLLTLVQDGANWVIPAGTVLDQAARDAIAAGQAYVVARAATGEAIRGQLLGEGQSVVITNLSGDTHFPEIVTTASGTASLTLDTVNERVIVNAAVTGIDDATAAHLHECFAGQSGDVLIVLEQDASDVSRWSVDTAATADQIADIARGGTYFNFHTPAYPGGELRGQVIPAGVNLWISDLSGFQVVPAVSTSATGRASLRPTTLPWWSIPAGCSTLPASPS